MSKIQFNSRYGNVYCSANQQTNYGIREPDHINGEWDLVSAFPDTTGLKNHRSKVFDLGAIPALSKAFLPGFRFSHPSDGFIVH